MSRVFACSDLHGQYDLFKKIKDFLGEDDKCIVLGDCVDRGPGSIKILLEIMADKRFTMLVGNHEEMMYQALKDAEEGYMDFQLWYMNGGSKTHMEFMEYDRPTQMAILSFLKKLPAMVEYKDIILTHAGFDFSFEVEVIGGSYDRDELVWDRSHIKSDTISRLGKTQVHGHTPTASILDKKVFMETLTYKPGKTCIDTGCCFFKTPQAGLLDLDTMETTYFKRYE